MNKYIHPLPIKIDVERIQNIAMNDMYRIFDKQHYHHRKIDDHPYLLELKTRFPIFSDIYNLYNIRLAELEPHQDADRQCALNIPVLNTQDSDTIFYSRGDNGIDTKYHQRRIYDEFSPEELREEYRFTLLEPTIINTQEIHSVIHRGVGRRIIFSWSILPEYSFEDALEFFKQHPDGVF